MRDLAARGAVVLVLCAAAGGASGARAGHGVRGTVCRANVRHDVLPVWMRGGFSGPRPRVPYALGKKRLVGGVIFGWPLHAPPLPYRSNKILWVSRHPSETIAPFWIRMQLLDGDRPVGAPVRKIVATGPGPSIVDVPSVGCWRMTFSWSGRRDTLDLEYTAPP